MNDPRTRALLALDRQHVWHPYTPADDPRDPLGPLVIDRAEGAFFWDSAGKRYIDANSSWWVATLGHRHPRLIKTLQTQSETLTHIALGGITHEPAAKLAQELTAIMPGHDDPNVPADRKLSRVFYSDDGSTAVEVAIKLCAQYWAQNGRADRTKFLSFRGAFHGETVGATSVGGIDVFRKVYGPLLFEVVQLPPPWELAQASVESIVERIAREADTLAAVIIEPMVQGADGMRTYGPEFLRALREACTKSDVFLIADEVFTGLGRTGPMWACEHAGVVPDVLCSAKGLSGAMFPFAVTVANERMYDGFRGDSTRAFLYGHSYCGNPLGCAIAREVLAIYRDEDVLAHAQSLAPTLAEGFARIAQRIPQAQRPRALGMLGAVDLSTSSSADYHSDLGWRVFAQARKRGVYLRPLGATVYIAPPLTIAHDTLHELLAVVEESVAAALSQSGSF
ncbi:MAG: adenosylmethionine--8-amino-7-oxononanoate transaminase [Deltaproteobacteria bacterium]|nr:adenosylmethionine--8-amino-7-oxononanoate transaminase [Deltaproteobacteria bacterium]